MRPASFGPPALLALFLFSAGCLTAGRDPVPAVGAPGLPASGAELYVAACSSCHGVDGRGMPVDRVGFPDPLPDFTDCNFASREPDGDWIAIAHQGGPARAFATTMPAFGESLSEAELQRILDHIRTLCPDRSWPSGNLNFPRPLVVEKAFPEDEVVVESAMVLEGDARSVSNQIVYEHRIGPRGQLELLVPLDWAEGADGWRGGNLGDVALGYKHAVAHSKAAGRILSFGGEVILPTGDEGAGFGKGVVLLEPFVSFGQGFRSDAFVQLQAGAEVPLVDLEKEVFWRGALGKSFAQQGGWGRTWTPMVELLGARELDAEAPTAWHVVPQLQVTLSRRQHIMANVGVRLPVDGSGDKPQWMVYLLWDWFDGGLTNGW